MKKIIRLILMNTWIIVQSPFISFCQEAHLPLHERKLMHQETMDDQYLPNAHQNKKTSPAYQNRASGASNILSSTIFTIQVNVDGSGHNILDDAANEPSIAVNPLNENDIVIGWRQFDNVSSNFRQAGWSYSSDGGQTWTFPGKIEPGVFRSDPVLDYDSSGNFYYNSLTTTPDYFCKVFESTNGGASWNSGTPAQGGDKQCMTIDRTPGGVGTGNIYSSWSSAYSTCMPGFFTRSTNGNGSYESCTELDDDPFWGTMAVGNAGELYVGAASGVSDSLVVIKSVNAQVPGSAISWNAPVLVDMDGYINGYLNVNPMGLLGQAYIDVDRTNGPGHDNVYLLASLSRVSNTDPGDVMFVKSTDGGLTWSSPIRVNDDASEINTQWFGTMSIAPNGRIDVVWLDTRDAPLFSDSSALYYSYSLNQGNTSSVNERLSPSFDPHIGYPNQDKMGDYFDMISDSAGAHLAWTNTLNGEEDVYYSRIMPQITVRVNEIDDNLNFSLYPNPTSGIFSITTEEGPSQIEIYNVLGETVYRERTSGVKNVLDISSAPGGIYFLKLINKNGNSSLKKIIKQ